MDLVGKPPALPSSQIADYKPMFTEVSPPLSTTALRIALPTPSFLPTLGGAEVGLHNIALRLHRLGHRPIVIAPSPHFRQLRRRGWKMQYEVIPFPPKIWGVLRHWPAVGLFLFERFYSRLQRRYGFDVWHGTMGYPVGITLVPFAVKRGLPHLVRCAGADIQTRRDIGYGLRLNKNVNRLIHIWLPMADRLVAITESVVQEYRALEIEDRRIARIPNGVDLARFQRTVHKSALRRSLGIEDDRFVFLTVSRHHPKKNLAGLIRACALLRQQGTTDFTLVIVGSKTSELRALVTQSGLGSAIVLYDEIGNDALNVTEIQAPSDTLVDTYLAADAFVLPSLIETFGIVLVEAMAAGLPVITTNAPGCRDVIREGKDGLIVPAGDDQSLAVAMDRVLQDTEFRNWLSERARIRANEFSWDSVVQRYVDVYRQIIAERSLTS